MRVLRVLRVLRVRGARDRPVDVSRLPGGQGSRVPVICTSRDVAAPSALVHDLLTDVEAWRLWSPHVASVEPAEGHVQQGQRLRVRPWFGPPTHMDVETVEPGRGMTWSTPGLGHVLRYGQHVAPTGDDRCRVTFTAEVVGRAGRLATRVAAPLSAVGQRRRLARLAALAELLHARGVAADPAAERPSAADAGPPVLDASSVGTAAFWDARYGGRDDVWSGLPNEVLLAEMSGPARGRAVDVACGEGADTLWLAQQGWDVTGVDVSPLGLARAERLTAAADPEAAARLRWRAADVVSGPVPGGPYDLVVSSFLHLGPDQRAAALRSLAAAVAPGGEVLVVLHSPADLEAGVQRPPLPELFAEAEEVAAGLVVAHGPEAWERVTVGRRPRRQRSDDGQEVDVVDEVVRLRRRAA